MGNITKSKNLFGDSAYYGDSAVSKKKMWQALYLKCEILIASLGIIKYNNSRIEGKWQMH